MKRNAMTMVSALIGALVMNASATGCSSRIEDEQSSDATARMRASSASGAAAPGEAIAMLYSQLFPAGGEHGGGTSSGSGGTGAGGAGGASGTSSGSGGDWWETSTSVGGTGGSGTGYGPETTTTTGGGCESGTTSGTGGGYGPESTTTTGGGCESGTTSSTGGGAEIDPNTLYLMVGSSARTCGSPWGSYDCGNWSVTIGVPPALQERGIIELSNPELITVFSVQGPDEGGGYCYGGGGSFMDGTLEIVSINDTQVVFRLHDTAAWDVEADGQYIAPRCP